MRTPRYVVPLPAGLTLDLSNAVSITPTRRPVHGQRAINVTLRRRAFMLATEYAAVLHDYLVANPDAPCATEYLQQCQERGE